MAHPLYELLRGDTEWKWGPAECEAFRNLKTALATAPVLTSYDANKPSIVSADAAATDWGASYSSSIEKAGNPWPTTPDD